jgi:hypothetical protein
MRPAPRDDGLWVAVLFSALAGSLVAGTIVTIPDRAVSLTVATAIATLGISGAAFQAALLKRRMNALRAELGEKRGELEEALIRVHGGAPAPMSPLRAR